MQLKQVWCVYRCHNDYFHPLREAVMRLQCLCGRGDWQTNRVWQSLPSQQGLKQEDMRLRLTDMLCSSSATFNLWPLDHDFDLIITTTTATTAAVIMEVLSYVALLLGYCATVTHSSVMAHVVLW